VSRWTCPEGGTRAAGGTLTPATAAYTRGAEAGALNALVPLRSCR
jgi:hypothetical protein